eukprot:944803_1
MSGERRGGQERDRKRPRLSPSPQINSSDKDEGEDSKSPGEIEADAGKKIVVSLTSKVYDGFLETFECPICNVSMYDGPILQCPAGHTICQQCKDKLPRAKSCPQCRKRIGDSRNRALEEMAQKMPMPCKNKQFGCQIIPLPSERGAHAAQCNFVPIQCP